MITKFLKFVKKYPYVLLLPVIAVASHLGFDHSIMLFVLSGTWSAGGNLGTARDGLAGAGTQTAGLSFGGKDTGYNIVATTEEYDGTSWSAGSEFGTERRALAGCGTQSAGLNFGGYDINQNIVVTTEEYNGTNWLVGGDLGIARMYLAGCGTQTAGLSFGGEDASNNTVVTEEYDGTSWSVGGNLVIAIDALAGAGTQTAGLGFGGYANGALATVEEYNGTDWSTGGDLGTARMFLAGCGTQTAGLSFGGKDIDNNIVATTEEYDGTSWSAGGDLATARDYLAGAGIQTAGLSFGGYEGGMSANTEEYNPVIIPSVSTLQVNNVKDTEVTGNGNVLEINDTDITERGFVYDTSSHSNPGNVDASSSGYINNVNETGTFSTGAFDLVINSLTKGTTYYVRAYAKNDYGIGNYSYGNEISFIAGEIKKVDTTSADFDLGTYTDIRAINNNLELKHPDVSESFEGSFPPSGWSTGGDVNWFQSTNQFHGGSYSAEGGDISNSQSSYLEWTAPNAGDLSFWWKVSSESGWDELRFKINGIEQFNISGEVDWEQKTGIAVNSNDVLRWEYIKDSSVSNGSDTGWIDDIISAGPGYVTSGTYVSEEIDISNLYSADDSQISWNETLNGQSLSVYSRYSTSSGSDWSPWAQATSGSAMSGVSSIGINTANALVQYKVEMSGDGSATPQLSDITMRVIYEGTPANSVSPSISPSISSSLSPSVSISPSLSPSISSSLSPSVSISPSLSSSISPSLSPSISSSLSPSISSSRSPSVSISPSLSPSISPSSSSSISSSISFSISSSISSSWSPSASISFSLSPSISSSLSPSLSPSLFSSISPSWSPSVSISSSLSSSISSSLSPSISSSWSPSVSISPSISFSLSPSISPSISLSISPSISPSSSPEDVTGVYDEISVIDAPSFILVSFIGVYEIVNLNENIGFNIKKYGYNIDDYRPTGFVDRPPLAGDINEYEL